MFDNNSNTKNKNDDENTEPADKSDKPKKLNNNNDDFNILEKTKAIKEILKSDVFDCHNSVALYGDWGSGKSSVILTLIEEFKKDKDKKDKDEDNIITIKFDAWKYEKEGSLAYALLEHIIYELEKNDNKVIKYEIKAIKDNVLKSGKIVLKSVNVNYGFFGLSFENNNKDVDCGDIDNLTKGIEKISKILNENNKRLIVFIDELDRCEPKNILDLLSSLKAIFNASNENNCNNIIYFVAIDKDAVSKALKKRYGEIMKSEEYLEKIFNISFSMPKHFELKNFIKRYDSFNDENAEKLARFFEYIKFTNPRHIKKVLNKYEILAKFKDDGVDGGLIPEIITKNRNKYLFDTIFVLYFIILYEFYYEKYLEIKNIDDKLNNYASCFRHIGWNEQKNKSLKDKPRKTIIEWVLKKYMGNNDNNDNNESAAPKSTQNNLPLLELEYSV